ncbi:MAG: glycosyltransferase family 2 protein, partial [Pyrinomonadaceae bacterium]
MADTRRLLEYLYAREAIPGGLEELRDHLETMMETCFSNDTNLGLARDLISGVFGGNFDGVDLGKLEGAELAYAENVRSFAAIVANAGVPASPVGNVSTADLELDFLPEDVNNWSIWKAINCALMRAIPINKRVAIVTSIRNEGLGILEWLAHHRSIGAAEIFVYTNNNTDGSSSLLDRLAENEFIRLINNNVGPKTAPQIKSFEHSLHFLAELREYEWVFYLDADEFFVPKSGSFDAFFRDFGAAFSGEAPDAVSFNWKWYGSENARKWTDGLIVRRFEHCIDNSHVKSLVRLSKVISMKPLHCPILAQGSFAVNSDFKRVKAVAVELEPTYCTGQVNHYWNKSFEEFVIKKLRGRGAVGRNGEQHDFSTFFDWGNNSVRGSYEPLPDSILQLTQVEMDKLSAIPGVLDELKNIHSTFKDSIAEIDSAHNLEAIFQARGTKTPKEAINMKNEGLSFARQFKPLSQDVLDFGGLSPLQSGSPWSVIAFIQPTTSQQYAGIISKRTEFKVGKNQFTFWLKNGSISVEADTQGGTSGLVPPLNRWSYVGAASSSHQTTIYLGVDGEVSFEHRKGIVTGTAEGQLPLTIGKLGGNFPGAIAFVWLYAEALPKVVMRDLCAGTLAPADVKGLAFGWTARRLGEIDVVSGSAPNVIGTKLIRLDDLRPKS